MSAGVASYQKKSPVCGRPSFVGSDEKSGKSYCHQERGCSSGRDRPEPQEDRELSWRGASDSNTSRLLEVEALSCVERQGHEVSSVSSPVILVVCGSQLRD